MYEKNLDLEKKRTLADKHLKLFDKLDYMTAFKFELFLNKKANELTKFADATSALALVSNEQMTVEEKAHFRDIVKAVSILQCAHFANSVVLDDKQLKLYAISLYDLNAQNVSEAVLQIIQTQKYFPTVSEIRETVAYISLCKVYDRAEKMLEEFDEKNKEAAKKRKEKEQKLLQEQDCYDFDKSLYPASAAEAEATAATREKIRKVHEKSRAGYSQHELIEFAKEVFS